MRAIIIDDEANNRANLTTLLQRHCPEVVVVATGESAAEGRRLIASFAPDLLLLDIQLSGENGFEMLESLTSYTFELIFVTAYDQYGIQAIRFSALDYLLKPIDSEALKQAVRRAGQRLAQKQQNLQLENLVRMLQHSQQRQEHRIALPAAKETRFVKTSEIIQCESENNYTLFYLASGEQLLVSRPLYEYDELLKGYGFIRCHNSHLVNTLHVKSWIKEDSGYLLMENGQKIPVSRMRRDLTKTALRL